jgi:hypothetical protein
MVKWLGYGVLVLLLLAAAPLQGLLLGALTARPGWLCLIAFFAFIALGLGVLSKKTFWGVLIDERNRISLSRLQVTLWTLVLLPTLSTVYWTRYQQLPSQTPPGKVWQALDFAVPDEVWALLGIQLTSAAASRLILTQKKEKLVDNPTRTNGVTRMNLLGDDGAKSVGALLARDDVSKASWSDLVLSEEVGDAGTLDLSRVQNLFFTGVVVTAYFHALSELFGGNGLITALPPISSGMVTLVGISHAGYLTAKAVPKTPAPTGTRV